MSFFQSTLWAQSDGGIYNEKKDCCFTVNYIVGKALIMKVLQDPLILWLIKFYISRLKYDIG